MSPSTSQLEEVRRAPAPVDAEVLGQERAGEQAGPVVHPALPVELAHPGVHDRAGRSALRPRPRTPRRRRPRSGPGPAGRRGRWRGSRKVVWWWKSRQQSWRTKGSPPGRGPSRSASSRAEMVPKCRCGLMREVRSPGRSSWPSSYPASSALAHRLSSARASVSPPGARSGLVGPAAQFGQRRQRRRARRRQAGAAVRAPAPRPSRVGRPGPPVRREDLVVPARAGDDLVGGDDADAGEGHDLDPAGRLAGQTLFAAAGEGGDVGGDVRRPRPDLCGEAGAPR